MESPYLTYKQAAEYTNLSEVTLWRAIKNGNLKTSGPGKAIRFHKDDLDHFMRKR